MEQDNIPDEDLHQTSALEHNQVPSMSGEGSPSFPTVLDQDEGDAEGNCTGGSTSYSDDGSEDDGPRSHIPGNIDSSDIEVIQDSSDSIEVLDSGSAGNGEASGPQAVRGTAQDVMALGDDEAAGQRIGYRDPCLLAGQTGLESAEVSSDALLATQSRLDAQAAGGDTVSIQESVSSDTPTLQSLSSGNLPGSEKATPSHSAISTDSPARSAAESPARSGERLAGDESRPAGGSRGHVAEADWLPATPPNYAREWRDSRSDRSSSPVSSSVSASPYESPTHRAGADPSARAAGLPLEPHVIDLSAADEDGVCRPDSLSLPRPLQFYERQRLSKKDSISSYTGSSRSSSMDALIEAASSTPLSTQGTLTMDGDMMAFVAEGLEHMIKMSSPLSRKDSSGASFSGSHTPKSISSLSSSTSGWSSSGFSYSGISRSPSVLTASPEDIPPIDPRAMMDLEAHAMKVADSLDSMMQTLNKNLHKMSSITYHCLDAYKDGIDHTCDSVDSGIKSMYALMAKCEELSKSMRPIYHLQNQISEINRLLDMFEVQMARDDT